MTNRASEQNGQAERIEGTVERITFRAEDTGFCIIKVRVKGRRELVAVKGHFASIAEGEAVGIEGRWGVDPKWGEEFRAERLEPMMPASRAGITRFLGSGLIKGIGPELAKRIVERFDEETLAVLDGEPDRLREVEGIGAKRVEVIRDAWREHRSVRRILVAMQGFGIGLAHAKRIFDTFADRAVEVVRTEPYRLAREIRGIGFKTADGIALSVGIPKDSPQRVRAGCTHVLWEMTGDGHVCVPRAELVKKATEVLGVDEAIVERSLDEAIGSREIIPETFDGATHLYAPALLEAESLAAARLIMLATTAARRLREIDVDKALEWAARGAPPLAKGQRDAVAMALRERVCVITGGPGVGKTTVTRTILRIVRATGARIALAAPTGRAAKRLAEATGQEAKTVHRLLDWSPQEGRFTKCEESPLAADVLVIDEVSMVDVSLFCSLVRAIAPGTTLILVGDRDQLPSVGPGTVLGDVIGSGTIPVVQLTEVFRQSARSRIVAVAHSVNEGEVPDLTNPPADQLGDFYFIEKDDPIAALEALKRLVAERIPQRFGLHPVRDVQVLTPMHRGEVGVSNLNRELQALLNPSPPMITRYGRSFAVGDKVMQTMNDYEKEVWNGDIGRISFIDAEGGALGVAFEDGRRVEYGADEIDALQLAYAISVHKSQGSEYPAIVVPLLTQHFVMLKRNLVYTALTRARSLCCLVGSARALGIAVHARGEARRYGFLDERLRREARAAGEEP